MATLVMRFPGRRYHATPWGHHVNEGLIEWPPSPWRLLRALLSTGYTTGLWSGDEPPPIARSLIEKLADVLPRYCLPTTVGAHSRHYMPLGRFKNCREDTTLVFDTWARIDSGELVVSWDVDLTEEELLLLQDLAVRMGYVGRSESWVMTRVAEPDEIFPEGDQCLPCEEASAPGPGWEQTPLLAAQPSSTYSRWRESAVASELAGLPVVDPNKQRLSKEDKKALEQRLAAEAPYPRDLIACLQSTTNWLHKFGWSQPPGSRRVLYWRRTDIFETGASRPRTAGFSGPSVEAMLLSMATANRNDSVLPSIVRTLPQAELLHRALVGAAGKQYSAHSEVLSGCDENRKPLAGRHQHAHILPLDLDGDGHLDHFLIWASMGLDPIAQAAVRSTRRTFAKRGPEPIRLALTGTGTLEGFRSLPGVYGDGLRSILGPPNGSTEWISLTPFVPPRFVKRRGRNTIEGQVVAELSSRGLPAPVEVCRVDIRDDSRLIRQRHFIRSRRYGPAPPIDCGFQLRLSFAAPLHGPVCLGYGSHFGLGIFAAIA